MYALSKIIFFCASSCSESIYKKATSSQKPSVASRLKVFLRRSDRFSFSQVCAYSCAQVASNAASGNALRMLISCRTALRLTRVST